MPKNPATILIGNASTVMTVKVYSVRLLLSICRALISSCSRLIRSVSPEIVEHHGKLLGELTKLLNHGAIDPRRRPVEESKHGCRFGANSR